MKLLQKQNKREHLNKKVAEINSAAFLFELRKIIFLQIGYRLFVGLVPFVIAVGYVEVEHLALALAVAFALAKLAWSLLRIYMLTVLDFFADASAVYISQLLSRGFEMSPFFASPSLLALLFRTFEIKLDLGLSEDHVLATTRNIEPLAYAKHELYDAHDDLMRLFCYSLAPLLAPELAQRAEDKQNIRDYEYLVYKTYKRIAWRLGEHKQKRHDEQKDKYL